MAQGNTKLRTPIMLALVVLGAGALYFGQLYFGPKTATGAQSVSAPVPDGFVVPPFNELERAGAQVFEKNCQVCHGQYGLGSDKGPPFMNPIYAPPVHGDGAFVFAVAQGSQQHHWGFGNMPEIPDVSRSDVDAIVAYIRALQSANGFE